MIKDKLKKNIDKNGNKRKAENTIFFILILIVTVFFIDNIWTSEKSNSNKNENSTSSGKVLADLIEDNENSENAKDNTLEARLSNILGTIKGVGKVNVFINYSQSSSSIPIYDETTTTSTTSETDSSGGVRNVTETQTQKDVIFKENSRVHLIH